MIFYYTEFDGPCARVSKHYQLSHDWNTKARGLNRVPFTRKYFLAYIPGILEELMEGRE
jgi:hypothetical protein